MALLLQIPSLATLESVALVALGSAQVCFHLAGSPGAPAKTRCRRKVAISSPLLHTEDFTASSGRSRDIKVGGNWEPQDKGIMQNEITTRAGVTLLPH